MKSVLVGRLYGLKWNYMVTESGCCPVLTPHNNTSQLEAMQPSIETVMSKIKGAHQPLGIFFHTAGL